MAHQTASLTLEELLDDMSPNQRFMIFDSIGRPDLKESYDKNHPGKAVKAQTEKKISEKALRTITISKENMARLTYLMETKKKSMDEILESCLTNM